MKKLIIGIGGASGVIYGVRLLEMLKDVKNVETHLVLSQTALLTLRYETDWTPDEVTDLADCAYRPNDLAAAVASGSFRTDGMIVAACSMKTLSAIAHSYTDNLLTRAADVCLKERRPLILMPRETPLHAGHCELLHKAALLGAIIAPPMPAMYARPKTIDMLIDQTAARVLDLVSVETPAFRWTGPPEIEP